MERKIHHNTINNEQAKINIGGMRIRGRKETRKSLRDVLRNREGFWSDRTRGNSKSEEQKPG